VISIGVLAVSAAGMSSALIFAMRQDAATANRITLLNAAND
jgi:hypothetical protein